MSNKDIHTMFIYQVGTWAAKNGGSDFAFIGIRPVIFAAYTFTIH